MPAVSVIIPAYNHEQYVEYTLQSVFSQTFTDYEVIVVNDGSPDDTSKRLGPYQVSGSVQYHEKENGGQAAARNFGLQLAQGEFIAFLDDDDLWPSDKLEWQVRCLLNSDLIAVGGTCGWIVDGIKREPEDQKQERFLKHADFYHGNPFVSPGQVLIRADSLHKIGGFDISIWGADDLDLWMRLSLEGKILKTPKNSLWYRKHPANASKNRIRMLENSKKVIQKNSGRFGRQERRQHQRHGYRWLYGYAGRGLILDAKRALKNFDLKKFTKTTVCVSKAFFPYALLDTKLAMAIGKDWIPNRILAKTRSRKGTK